MKTIWGIIFIISISSIFFFGLQDVGQQATINNINLDNQSLEKMGQYDNRLINLSTFAAAKLDTSLSSNNTNSVEAFYRESAESKNTIEKVSDSIDFVYNIPTLLLIAIPFVEFTDTALFFYKLVMWFLISVIVLLAGYKAIRTGQVDGGK